MPKSQSFLGSHRDTSIRKDKIILDTLFLFPRRENNLAFINILTTAKVTAINYSPPGEIGF